MTPTTNLDLSTFDDQLLDGLDFYEKVYALLAQIRAEADGIKKLRLLETKREKRLLEELIPLACYVKMHYQEGRRIEVRWLSGSQEYDATLFSSGPLVENGIFPKEVVVEITTSVHQNDYLLRQLLQEQGGAFGVKGISKDRKTGIISSTAYGYMNGESESELTEQIISRIRKKAEKPYAPNTVLIVVCIPNSMILEDEWEDVVARVIEANVHQTFSEVFLLYNWDSFSATLSRAPK